MYFAKCFEVNTEETFTGKEDTSGLLRLDLPKQPADLAAGIESDLTAHRNELEHLNSVSTGPVSFLGQNSTGQDLKMHCQNKAEFKVMSLAKVKTAESGTHHVLNQNSPACKLEMQFMVELNHHQ